MRRDPLQLWLIRHGQSQGNVARDLAHASGAEVLDIAVRDMDVTLSDLGRRQAAAFGHWLKSQTTKPNVVISSPYVRSVETATVALEAAGMDCELRVDERLREREFGVLDLLTTRGIETRFPAEAERRKRLGKFYHRPPGGESWVDVALRIRSLRDSLGREYMDSRVLLVTHEVVIVIWRYLLDNLTEADTLQLSRDHPIGNCSLTRYVTGDNELLQLDADAWAAPLEADDVPVTVAKDAPVAPR